MTPTSIKERPIPMTAESVRAILAGRKSQTRRAIPDDWWRCLIPEDVVDDPQELARVIGMCPYGVSGQRLWVKETWAEAEDQFGGTHVVYRADMKACLIGSEGPRGHEVYRRLYEPKPNGPEGDDNDLHWREPNGWKSPRFMHRWRSRLLLEITEVRVQRLQEISEADIKAEGFNADSLVGGGPVESGDDTPVGIFGELWDRINAKRGFSWETNPWVWAITFKVVKP